MDDVYDIKPRHAALTEQIKKALHTSDHQGMRESDVEKELEYAAIEREGCIDMLDTYLYYIDSYLLTELSKQGHPAEKFRIPKPEYLEGI